MLEDQQLYLGRLEVDMKFEPKNPPRKFKVGKLENNIVISDFGDLQLSDEQITIVSENGKRTILPAKIGAFIRPLQLMGD